MANVISKDGTKIAFSRVGSGPALIVVDGALCYRQLGPSQGLAKLLADNFTVYTYDRRGRGESGDMQPYNSAREVEDIGALIDAAGGQAALFGQSSGGALVLEAADKLSSKVTRFAMYEDPFFVDDSRPALPPDFVARMQANLAQGRPAEAVKMFMKLVGTPSLMVAIMPLMPMWKQLTAVSHTLPYDFAFMAEFQQGRALPKDRWPHATQPALAAVGSKSPAWMQHAMEQVAATVPNAEKAVLPGQNHMVKSEVLAPVLTEFLMSGKVAAGSHLV